MNINSTQTLKELRGLRSQREIAQNIGVCTSSYSMYERGQRTPSDKIKMRIADLYGMSVQELFFGDAEQ